MHFVNVVIISNGAWIRTTQLIFHFMCAFVILYVLSHFRKMRKHFLWYFIRQLDESVAISLYVYENQDNCYRNPKNNVGLQRNKYYISRVVCILCIEIQNYNINYTHNIVRVGAKFLKKKNMTFLRRTHVLH